MFGLISRDGTKNGYFELRVMYSVFMYVSTLI
jgi:hypothetical protein